MRAHFFDIGAIISADSKAWIVDKKDPKTPILKVSESDFNLIRSGIYKSQGNRIKFAGKEYWLPEDIMSTLKIRCKKLNKDVSELAFSMREYMDREVIDTLEYGINMENLSLIKNSTDDIYVICSSNTKENYSKIIGKIEGKLEAIGLKIKKYYFISETFYERDADDISHKKARLVLQHLLGMKTSGDRLSDEALDSYSEIRFYDDDARSVKAVEDINSLLKLVLDNSEDSLKKAAKERISQERPSVVASVVTPNKVNRLSSKKIDLDVQNIARTFESFSRYYRK
jgi:hypothetical protein